MSDEQEDPWVWVTPEIAAKLSQPLKFKARQKMETAKDILDRLSTDTTTKGRVKYEDALKAMKEIADRAWEAGDTYRSEQFGSMLGQENAADIVPDKSTFMKELFPDTK